MTPDGQLLRQYAEEGSDAAFAELVRRHVDLVYSVAVRQAAGDTALAQDATQSVFIDLARKARVLCGRPTLSGWLHTSARFAASKAIRGEQRRRAHEQESLAMNETPATAEMNWDQLRPLLDESVGQLKEADRDAIVLRYFQGKNHQEIGAILGLSENSANKRVERALEKLRGYFVSRGVKTSATLLATAISANSVQAAPVGLAEKITPASLAGASGALAGGTFLTVFLAFSMNTKTKITLGVVIFILLAVSLAIKWQSANEQPPAAVADSVPPAKTVAPPVINVPAQVVAPVVKPAPVVSAPVEPPPAIAAVVSDPRVEVGTAMKDFVRLLELGDYVNAADNYMQLPPNISGQQLVEIMQQNPDFPKTVKMMTEATKAAQTETPEYNDTGDVATYKLSQTTEGKTVVRWKKINGTWQVDAFE